MPDRSEYRICSAGKNLGHYYTLSSVLQALGGLHIAAVLVNGVTIERKVAGKDWFTIAKINVNGLNGEIIG